MHRWGRSRITPGITGVLLVSVPLVRLQILVRRVARVAGGNSAIEAAAGTAGALSNDFWLTSICFGFIGTLRYTLYKEISGCEACSGATEPPF